MMRPAMPRSRRAAMLRPRASALLRRHRHRRQRREQRLKRHGEHAAAHARRHAVELRRRTGLRTAECGERAKRGQRARPRQPSHRQAQGGLRDGENPELASPKLTAMSPHRSTARLCNCANAARRRAITRVRRCPR
jgi:hypothetical protein